MDALEQDYHNFSTPSSHRLPTVSGAEAIRNVRRVARPIPTSLARLDSVLGKASTFNTSLGGGIQRGLVTEVFGPPGVGKTTFALQVATNTFHGSGSSTSVTWIDTSSQLVQSRLQQLSEAYQLPQGHEPPSSPPLPNLPKETLLVEKFNYLQITSLPKLLTLFLHPTTSFPQPNTGLIVLDDLSNLILSSLPRSSRSVAARGTQKSPSAIQDAALAKRALSRRFQVLSSFAAALQKFAATNNVAILVTSKATVNFKNGQRAVLRPALTSQQWDNYLSVRIALYRDFWPEQRAATQDGEGATIYRPTEFERRSLRYAKVTRLAGKLVSSPEIGFVIVEGGLREVNIGLNETDARLLPMATQPLRPLEDVIEPGGTELRAPASDAEQAEDTSEAGVSASALHEVPGKSKRKAIEIADSEEESDGGASTGDDLPVAPTAPQNNGFRPSSQIHEQASHSEQDVGSEPLGKSQSDVTRPVGAKAGHANAQDVSAVLNVDEEDEMLLETYERTVPPFSQAAAEMSDPLTPSDDGRDIS